MNKFVAVFATMLSLTVSCFALKLAWDAKQATSHIAKDGWYLPQYTTDEQSAVMFGEDSPVFKNETNMKIIAARALGSICAQIKCGDYKDYVYSFDRDGLGAAGAFWYDPINKTNAKSQHIGDHFLCRFRNENYVFCHIKRGGSKHISMAIARTQVTKGFQDWERSAEIREK